MGYRAFVFLHRWSGLVVAALVIVIGLTGSILVFRDGLDRRLNADILDVQPRGTRLDADALVAAVEKARPGAQVTSLVPFEDPMRAWNVGIGRTTVYVDPYDGRITGERTRGDGGFSRRGFMPLVHGLHHDLLLEAPGHWIVAGVGLFWMLLSLVGIYLSLKQAGGFRNAFKVRADVNLKRLFVDLHRSFGLATVVLIVVICISGIYLALRQDVTKLVGVFSPVTPAPERALAEDRIADAPVGFGQALAAASSAAPGARVQSAFAVRPKGVYRVRVTSPGDLNDRGDRFVYVSMRDAAIVQVRDVKRGSAGDVFIGWQFPLHTGEAFGAAGQAVVFVLGLLPLLFSITGVYLWLKNRRQRRVVPSQQARQQPSGSQRPAQSINQ